MEQNEVLIIDDDSRNIFALTAVLRSKGYAVASATAAKEGIDMMRNNEGIKVVLMDMMMPDMDGYEAIGVIKRDDDLRERKVIAVTAQAMVGDRERCLEAGADDYVSKPIDVDFLLNILQSYNRVTDDQR
jgi:CheY-like chemotaxis protein